MGHLALRKQSSQIPQDLSRKVKLFSRIFQTALIEAFHLESRFLLQSYLPEYMLRYLGTHSLFCHFM